MLDITINKPNRLTSNLELTVPLTAFSLRRHRNDSLPSGYQIYRFGISECPICKWNAELWQGCSRRFLAVELAANSGLRMNNCFSLKAPLHRGYVP